MGSLLTWALQQSVRIALFILILVDSSLKIRVTITIIDGVIPAIWTHARTLTKPPTMWSTTCACRLTHMAWLLLVGPPLGRGLTSTSTSASNISSLPRPLDRHRPPNYGTTATAAACLVSRQEFVQEDQRCIIISSDAFKSSRSHRCRFPNARYRRLELTPSSFAFPKSIWALWRLMTFHSSYKDEQGNPWILPSVRAAKGTIRDANHEYLPILGLVPFRTLATQLVYGEKSAAINEERVSGELQCNHHIL